MEMYDTYFIMDESGDRGFLDNEPSLDSFGLIAGFAFPVRNKPLFEKELKTLFNNLEIDKGGKVRAASVFVGNRNIEVKNEYIKFFLDSELLIVYQAMFLRGAFIMRQLAKKMKEHTKQFRRNNHIKILSKKKKHDVYFEILAGLLTTLDDICKIKDCSNLAILTDRVDKKILHDARGLLNRLKRDEHCYKKKAVDTQKDKPLEGQLVSKLNYPVAIKNINMIDVPDTPELIFAGDFLSNSIYRHLKEKIHQGSEYGLNSQKIMQDFPLAPKIALLNDNNVTDKLFSPHRGNRGSDHHISINKNIREI